MGKKPTIDLENLLIGHVMMLVKVGSLKIENKEEVIFSKGSKSKPHCKTKDNSQARGDTDKSKKPKSTEVKGCYR